MCLPADMHLFKRFYSPFDAPRPTLRLSMLRLLCPLPLTAVPILPASPPSTISIMQSDVYSFGVVAYELLSRELLLVAVFNTVRAARLGVADAQQYAALVGRRGLAERCR